MPTWLAPNTITLIGFTFCLVPFVLLFSLWGTTFDKTDAEIAQSPRWFYGFYGVCYFMYRMLDECDGKQARRTGNSSPLGMLFDHGCDAFTVSYCLMIFMKFLNFGNNMHAIVWFSGSISLFHFTNMEEYYIGGMFLGTCNPISDMSILIYGIMIYLTCFGDESLHYPIIPEGALWKNSPLLDSVMLLIISNYMFIVYNVVHSIYKIFTKERFEGKGRPAKWYLVLYHFIVYWIMVFAVNSLAFAG